MSANVKKLVMFLLMQSISSSLSPVLTAISLSYGESKNSTPKESKPLTRLR